MAKNSFSRKLASTLLWLAAIPALAVVVAARGEGKPNVVRRSKKHSA